jgi:enoyl-CoA hydratase
MTQDVLFTEKKGKEGDVGLITLNRPQVLNSLNHGMIIAMYTQLQQWQERENIKAVVICASAGKAFCAGGDLRFTYETAKQHGLSVINKFFWDEYRLNKLIFHYRKPYIALLDGITMGGGVGIAIHGSHRIATEKLLFAMPETGIGFFPDVGGTYFLPRLPANMGFYLGLTGARINFEEAFTLGLVQHCVPSEKLPELLSAIIHSPRDEIIRSYTAQNLNSSSLLIAHKDIIEKSFSAPTIEDIFNNLNQQNNKFSQDTLRILEKKSPISLKVSLKAMQAGKNLDFDACMRQEYRLTCHFLQNHDFREGIRAVILDKDQSPKWQPATLEEISSEMVQAYFAPLNELEEFV